MKVELRHLLLYCKLHCIALYTFPYCVCMLVYSTVCLCLLRISHLNWLGLACSELLDVLL